jgi:hypothetical protein
VGNFGSAMAAAATTIVALALVAVLVSRRAQTPEVVRSVGDAFGGVLRAATGPVTGGFGNGL